MPAYGDGFAADSPIVGFNFINNYDRSLRIFSKDFRKQSGYFLDETRFLFRCSPFFRYLDIYVWHKSLRLISHLTRPHPQPFPRRGRESPLPSGEG